MNKRTVPAENFLATVAINVDNDRLTDAQFRQFIRNSLPIVIYQRQDEHVEENRTFYRQN